MKIAVMGTGSWGTALAQVLADNHNDVILYGINPKEVDDINLNHQNTKYFDCMISDQLKATTTIQDIEDADIVLLAVPTIAIESTAKNVFDVVKKKVYIINVAKGFHPVSHKRLSVVIEESADKDKLKGIISLIGPSHAEEVILRKLTCLNAVSNDLEAAKTIQRLFSNDYFRVYTNTDVIGAEVGVAVKNIMAIASGILEGSGQGDNARAALMTRGLAEMSRFGISCGGKFETYLGLDGVGDLIVTCTSTHSRNFMAGFEIGKTQDAATFMKNNTKTVEGILACKVVHEEAERLNISMPITDEVYAVLYEGKSPMDAISDLMKRELKAEN